MKSESRTYGLLKKYIRFMSLLLAIVFFIRGLLYLLIGFLSLTNITTYGLVPFLNALIYFGISSFLAPIFFMLIRDLYNPVVVDATGLHSKWFGKLLDIDWNDILDIKPIRLLGLLKYRNKYIVVTKSPLSLLHTFYGLFCGGTRQPSLPLDPSLSDYPNLIEKISKQAKQNRLVESRSEKESAFKK